MLVVHGITKSWTWLSDRQQTTKLRIGIFLSPPSNSNVQSSLRTIVINESNLKFRCCSLRNSFGERPASESFCVLCLHLLAILLHCYSLQFLSFQDMLLPLLLRMFVVSQKDKHQYNILTHIYGI